MRRSHDQRGHSLVEVLAAVTVMSIGIFGAYAAADGGTGLSNLGRSISRTNASGRMALGPLQDLVAETRVGFIDTCMRFSYRSSGYVYESDRFTLFDGNLRQCSSPVCRFHTDQSLSQNMSAYHCGFEYRSGSGVSPVARGKLWPSGLSTCPLDGAQLFNSATLDGVRFFTARGFDGSFTASATGTAGDGPNWDGLVLVFPYARGGELPALYRYEVHVSDLLGADGTVSYSADWSEFDPLAPSMLDLWDFGTDGTMDGVRDGSVPSTATASDSDYEGFYTGSSSNSAGQVESVVVWAKHLMGSINGYPQRIASLVVNLETGQTNLSVSHATSSTTYWTGSVDLSRAPKLLARDVTEFAVSTSVTNPYDASTNPTGVEDASVVRMTLVTTAEELFKGATRWVHHLDTFTLSPRN